jgi:glycosyltransferase involved in cell wall biosynthesis
MSEPLLTVGISFYNCEKTLLAAVKSIFAQTFQDWELVLIDGGSSDKSLEIAKSIKDPRVRVIGDGSYHTHPVALNKLIDVARGKYIANMDGDDLCLPTRLEKQLNLFKKDERLDVVGTGIVYLDENDVPLGHMIPPLSHLEICKEPYRTFRLCHGSIMAKRSWYLENKYNESAVKVEDFELWLRTYEHSKFSNVCEALYGYRCEASFNQSKRLKCRIMSTKFLFEHCRKKGQFIKGLYVGSIQLVKFVVGAAICVFWSKRKLLQRRYTPISEQEKEIYEREIRKIKQLEIPLENNL